MKYELAKEFAGKSAGSEVYRIGEEWFAYSCRIAHNDADLALLVKAGIVREVGEKKPRRMQGNPHSPSHGVEHDESPACSLSPCCIPVEAVQEKPAASIYTDAQGNKFEMLEIKTKPNGATLMAHGQDGVFIIVDLYERSDFGGFLTETGLRVTCLWYFQGITAKNNLYSMQTENTVLTHAKWALRRM